MRKKPARWTRKTHVFRRDDYECPVCGYLADKPYMACPRCATEMKASPRYDPTWIDELEMFDAIVDDEFD